jgi:hypothetical protein
MELIIFLNEILWKIFLKITLDSFIKYSKIDTSIQNKRICKTPFKKWYIK